MHEDELPENITDEEYDWWFKHSWVDGVRIGPEFTRVEDEQALAVAREIALMWGHDRSQFVSKIQVAVIDAMRWARATK